MPDISALIQRWQAGDDRAAEALYNHYREPVFRLACGLLGDPADGYYAQATTLAPRRVVLMNEWVAFLWYSWRDEARPVGCLSARWSWIQSSSRRSGNTPRSVGRPSRISRTTWTLRSER